MSARAPEVGSGTDSASTTPRALPKLLLSMRKSAKSTLPDPSKSPALQPPTLPKFDDSAENHHVTTVVHATSDGIARPPVDYSFPTRYRDAYLVELEFFLACVCGAQTVPVSHDDVRTNYLLATGLEIATREKRVVQFAEIPTHPAVTGAST